MSETEATTRKRSGIFSRPTFPYYLILACVLFLTGLGLVMVLSASSVKSFEESGNTYSIFIKQLLFLAIALSLSWVGMRMSPKVWVAASRLALIVSLGVLVLPQVPGLGKTINGNTNWIGFGPFTIQPSEFAKLGLILFCALQFRRYEERTLEPGPRDLVKMVLPGIALVAALVLIGKDLGTALIIMAIAGAMLYIGGVPGPQYAVIMGSGLVVAAGFIVSSKNRLDRFTAVLHPFSAHNYKLAGWQTAHSIMGLASGGFFGVGLGASRQKWANLAEANTDFIFSVIGEEMGLLGTLVVLALYAALIYGIFRVSTQTRDIFSRYAVAGIACWMMVQVAVNLGSDVGLFPVVGVTLPFISYGGSALIANWIAIAFVLNVARHDPSVSAYFKHHSRKSTQPAK